MQHSYAKEARRGTTQSSGLLRKSELTPDGGRNDRAQGGEMARTGTAQESVISYSGVISDAKQLPRAASWTTSP